MWFKFSFSAQISPIFLLTILFLVESRHLTQETFLSRPCEGAEINHLWLHDGWSLCFAKASASGKNACQWPVARRIRTLGAYAKASPITCPWLGVCLHPRRVARALLGKGESL